MEMLREKVKGLEQKIMEMIRHGQENVAIADRLHRCVRSVLLAPGAASLPDVLVSTLKHEFLIPLAALRLWDLAPEHAGLPVAQGVSDDVRSFATSLVLPYCGLNSGFEAVAWLGEGASVASVAMIPLYRPGRDEAFGLLVLGSPDATRYSAGMGTEFLQRIGEIAGAGLSRLLA